MKDKPGVYWIYFFSVVTILLNALMIFVVRNGSEEIFSNVFAISIVLVVLLLIKYAYSVGKEKLARAEYCGILLMFGISCMRFANRITILPDSINYSSIIVFLAAGTFLLFIGIGRILRIIREKQASK